MNHWKFTRLNPRWFNSPDLTGSGEQFMKPGLILDLYAMILFIERNLNKEIGVVMRTYDVYTSAYRTPEHNKRVGGSPNSSHMNGSAVDISLGKVKQYLKKEFDLTLSDSEIRYVIETAAAQFFKRRGHYSWGYHLDNDKNKPSPRFWRV